MGLIKANSVKVPGWAKIERYHPNYNVVLDYARTQGIEVPEADIRKVQDQYFYRPMAPFWSQADFLHLFAGGDDSDFACINVVNPGTYDCMPMNNPLYLEKLGFSGQPNDTHLRINYNQQNNAVNYSSDSAAIMVFVHLPNVTGNETYLGSSPANRIYTNIGAAIDNISGIFNVHYTDRILNRRGLHHLDFDGNVVRFYDDGIYVASASGTPQEPDSANFKYMKKTGGGSLIGGGYVGSSLRDDAIVVSNIWNETMNQIDAL